MAVPDLSNLRGVKLPALPVSDHLSTLNFEAIVKALTTEDWAAPTLVNSWANLGGGASPAGYYKDGFGRVFVRGRIVGGTTGSVAFTLPVGYRPAFDEYHVVLFGGPSFGYGIVKANGDVTLFYTGTGDAFLQLSVRAA